MYKIEQIDWEAVDIMVATQIVRVVHMIRSIQELDSKEFDDIKTNIIEKTIDSITDQLYCAFRYDGDIEYDQTHVDSLVSRLRQALESEYMFIDHKPIREEIKHMYRVRLLIEREDINKRVKDITTRLEEMDSQTD